MNYINPFHDRQYGFIKERSTVTQSLKILDEWTDNTGEQMVKLM